MKEEVRHGASKFSGGAVRLVLGLMGAFFLLFGGAVLLWDIPVGGAGPDWAFLPIGAALLAAGGGCALPAWPGGGARRGCGGRARRSPAPSARSATTSS